MIETIIPEDNKHWLQLRTRDVTSTEVSALFGLNPWMTEFELWHNKKSQAVIEIEDNERMKWGRRLEDPIAQGVAEDTGLFDPATIKVRMRGFAEYTCGTDDSDFIHVFASIMDGRTTAMKKALSQAVVDRLIELYPDVPNIAMNVWEFEKATYTKRLNI